MFTTTNTTHTTTTHAILSIGGNFSDKAAIFPLFIFPCPKALLTINAKFKQENYTQRKSEKWLSQKVGADIVGDYKKGGLCISLA